MFQKIQFTRQKLHAALAAYQDKNGIDLGSAADRLIAGRIWDLFRTNVVYGRQVPVGLFIQGAPSDVADFVCPVVVFRSSLKVLSASAVFMAVDPGGKDADVFYQIESIGVQVVPILKRYIEMNYLYSGDFKRRSKSAVFAPTQSFVPFPAIPANGWPVSSKNAAEALAVRALEKEG